MINVHFVRDLADRNATLINKCLEELKFYLKEGVLMQVTTPEPY